MEQLLMEIKENRRIAERIYRLVVIPIQENDRSKSSKEEKIIPLPGQFFHIRISETSAPLLRRPISVHDYHAHSGAITFIYREIGEGTKRLADKKTGEMIDVLGPLGTSFPVENITFEQKVVLIGGGVGIPPLYYLAKKLRKQGVKVTTLLGFQSKQDAFLIEEFKELGEVRSSTMDGSIGFKGTVMNLISSSDDWDTFYTCGPTGMMRAVKDKYIDTPMKGFVSLEERMACGIGACYGCIVKVSREIDPRGYKKVCADGPVFPFREVSL